MFVRLGPWLLGVLVLGGMPGLAVAQGRVPPSDKTIIVIRLPAAAKLTIDGEVTGQTGSERAFITPSLPAPRRYRYKLVATWMEGTQPRKVEYTVRFRRGQVVNADLNQDAARQVVSRATDGTKEKPTGKDRPKDTGKPDEKDKSREKLPTPRTEDKGKSVEKPKDTKKTDDKDNSREKLPVPRTEDKGKEKPDDKDKSREKLPVPKTESEKPRE